MEREREKRILVVGEVGEIVSEHVCGLLGIVVDGFSGFMGIVGL